MFTVHDATFDYTTLDHTCTTFFDSVLYHTVPPLQNIFPDVQHTTSDFLNTAMLVELNEPHCTLLYCILSQCTATRFASEYFKCTTSYLNTLYRNITILFHSLSCCKTTFCDIWYYNICYCNPITVSQHSATTYGSTHTTWCSSYSVARNKPMLQHTAHNMLQHIVWQPRTLLIYDTWLWLGDRRTVLAALFQAGLC